MCWISYGCHALALLLSFLAWCGGSLADDKWNRDVRVLFPPALTSPNVCWEKGHFLPHPKTTAARGCKFHENLTQPWMFGFLVWYL